MRISPSFESEDSFENFDTSTMDTSLPGTNERRVEIDMDWGVVSTTGSDVGASRLQRPTSGEHIGQGILIMDGISSEGTGHERSSTFSVPGSSAMPSEIGSIGEDFPPDDEETTWHVNKRMIYIVGSLILCAFVSVSGLLVRQHLRYQTAMKELGQKIDQLEKEKEAMPQPNWLGEGHLDDSSTFFTLLDTCWVKAKMNLEFGDCSTNSFGLCGEFVSHAKESVKTWFSGNLSMLEEEGIIPLDETIERLEHNEHNEHNDPDELNLAAALAKYPDIIGEAMVSASKAVSEMIGSLNLALDGTAEASNNLVRASEAFSDATKGSVSYNFNEFVKDPVKYFTGAVEEASHPSHSTKVSMNGLQIAAKSLSDVSADWANKVVESTETLSKKMLKTLNKPLQWLDSIEMDL